MGKAMREITLFFLHSGHAWPTACAEHPASRASLVTHAHPLLSAANVQPPADMADVYVIGQLVGADGFDRPNLLCTWEVITGAQWAHVEGHTKGQTHVLMDPDDGVWAHPIDVHYQARSIQGTVPAVPGMAAR